MSTCGGPSPYRTLVLLLVLVVVMLHRRSTGGHLEQHLIAADDQPTPPEGTTPPALHTSHAHLFDRAFFINADDSPKRRAFMERQLSSAGVRYERWSALRGSPALLQTHGRYFARGIERHLYANRSAASGAIVQWGTIGTYLSHHLLFESIVERWGHNDSARFLILQDDTQLKANWLEALGDELRGHSALGFSRLLLVWWGLARPAECADGWCRVHPPAGPTETDSPECCGKRFYHGLQAWLVKTHALKCLLRRLRERHIKNIDAQMVQCGCPHEFALEPARMLGSHLDRELGSERAAVNSVWRSKLIEDDRGGGRLKGKAARNVRKTGLTHLWGETTTTEAAAASDG